jgi:hypothetical protein
MDPWPDIANSKDAQKEESRKVAGPDRRQTLKNFKHRRGKLQHQGFNTRD